MMQRIFFLGLLLMVSIFAVGQNNKDVSLNNFVEIKLTSVDGEPLSEFNESGEYCFSFHQDKDSRPNFGEVILISNGTKTVLEYQIIRINETTTVYQLGHDGEEGLLFVTEDKIIRIRSQNNSVLTETFYWWDKV